MRRIFSLVVLFVFSIFAASAFAQTTVSDQGASQSTYTFTVPAFGTPDVTQYTGSVVAGGFGYSERSGQASNNGGLGFFGIGTATASGQTNDTTTALGNSANGASWAQASTDSFATESALAIGKHPQTSTTVSVQGSVSQSNQASTQYGTFGSGNYGFANGASGSTAEYEAASSQHDGIISSSTVAGSGDVGGMVNTDAHSGLGQPSTAAGTVTSVSNADASASGPHGTTNTVAQAGGQLITMTGTGTNTPNFASTYNNATFNVTSQGGTNAAAAGFIQANGYSNVSSVPNGVTAASASTSTVTTVTSNPLP